MSGTAKWKPTATAWSVSETLAREIFPRRKSITRMDVPIRSLSFEAWDERGIPELKKVLRKSTTARHVPPVILWLVNGHFEVSDGMHRLEAARAVKIREVPAVVVELAS